jgi:hypothetical protein
MNNTIFLRDLGLRLRVRRWLKISVGGLSKPLVYSAVTSEISIVRIRSILKEIQAKYELVTDSRSTDIGVRKTCGSFTFFNANSGVPSVTIAIDTIAETCTVALYTKERK